MDLADYLDRSGKSQALFAKEVNTTPATISRLVAKKLRPSLDLALGIERASEGAVPVNIWANDRAAA